MYILGMNAYHGDAAACIFKDGELIAAIEEERITRIKHWAGFPTESIKFCLEECGIPITEVDYVTVSSDPSVNFPKKVFYALKKSISLEDLKDRFQRSKRLVSIKDNLIQAFHVKPSQLKAKIQRVEHHRAHMASAFFMSPFAESALLSVDGFGDFTSTMIGMGIGSKIKVLDKVIYPHSLGVFYTTFTQYLGFLNYGDEYKVMGLAPYGTPSLVNEVKDLITMTDDGLFQLNGKYFKHFHKVVNMNWENGFPTIEPQYTNQLIEKLGPVRHSDEQLTQFHKDLAASVQYVCEEVIFHILNKLYQRTGWKNLCIAGGVAQNSVANGKVLEKTDFSSVYIPPAGYDAGTAIGSVLYLYHHVLGYPRRPADMHAYWGSQFTESQITAILNEKNIVYTRYEDDELFEKTVDCLINGGVVGWFQGKMEFGPRALGHRSILADPRREDARSLLNLKIKKRESFRPFAPSILKEYVQEYFEQADEVPFMEKVFKIKMSKQALIPAVTHVDGTGRLQTVDRQVEPKYYRLIETFKEKTGIPILLNTSFNENEPIVSTPQEALDCFLRTQMDMLIMENIIVER
ncbi:MAG: carbamoyltransferase [SAR324 cluster bacterium]|nr:carbamoyltransferase [SAR324 cluster bacterium]